MRAPFSSALPSLAATDISPLFPGGSDPTVDLGIFPESESGSNLKENIGVAIANDNGSPPQRPSYRRKTASRRDSITRLAAEAAKAIEEAALDHSNSQSPDEGSSSAERLDHLSTPTTKMTNKRLEAADAFVSIVSPGSESGFWPGRGYDSAQDRSSPPLFLSPEAPPNESGDKAITPMPEGYTGAGGGPLNAACELQSANVLSHKTTLNKSTMSLKMNVQDMSLPKKLEGDDLKRASKSKIISSEMMDIAIGKDVSMPSLVGLPNTRKRTRVPMR